MYYSDKPQGSTTLSLKNKLSPMGAALFIAAALAVGLSSWAQIGQAQNTPPQLSQQELQQRRVQAASSIQFRVGVMPLEHEPRHRDLATKFQGKLASCVRGMPNQHSVKLKRVDFPTCNQDWIEKGAYPIEVLAKANSVYNVDRVLFVRVNEWQAFEPMKIGLTLHLVDSREAQLLVSEDLSWSLQDPQVKAAYKKYLCKRFHTEGDISIYYRCPDYFSDFVAKQIAQLTCVR